jgi:transcriptional regulator with GAF, ATPase, and Fis domain
MPQFLDSEEGKEKVQAALDAHAWNLAATAESLGMTLPLLRAHVKKFGLTREGAPRAAWSGGRR